MEQSVQPPDSGRRSGGAPARRRPMPGQRGVAGMLAAAAVASRWAPGRRDLAGILAAAVVALLGAGPAHAQGALFGAAAGGGLEPRVVAAGCSGNHEDNAATIGGDLRAGTAPGGFGLEVRLGVQYALSGPCLTVTLPPPGVGPTIRSFSDRTNLDVSSDVRLRWEGALGEVVTVGSGWLWSAHAPYFVLGPGWRFGRRIRFLADADWMLAGVPYEATTYDTQGAPLWTTHRREWRSLGAIRTGVEVPIR